MLRRLLTTGAALAALASPLAAQTWQIDPAHSSVGFSVRHLMISNVHGGFGKVTGQVVTDPKDLTRSTVQATIDAASIDTRDAKRDGHLRGADFLDVERHPTILFKSTKVEAAGAGKWKLTGDLTLHGVTKPVVLDVEGTGETVKDLGGKTRAGARATGRINRKDFGIVWNKSLDGGGIAVGDEVAITIDVEAVQTAGVGG